MAPDLSDWILNRPIWQQDALRRICEQGSLTEADLDEVRSQIEADHGISVQNPVLGKTFDRSLLLGKTKPSPKTVLCSIGPLKNVDRLAAGQAPIKFAVDGITLIYGANGSGKSGYCRIAKKICRCLHEIKLKGDVFGTAPSSRREIELSFKVEGEETKRSLIWCDDDNPPPELSRISVFDAEAAGIYVDYERRIEFLPYQVDIITKLGAATKHLEEYFKNREKSLRQEVRLALPGGYTEGTVVSECLKKLTADVTELPSEENLRNLAYWNHELQEKYRQLGDELKHSPNALSVRRKTTKIALESVKSEIVRIKAALGASAIEDLKSKRANAGSKRELAALSAGDLFKDEPLPKIGNDAWRQMLRYAREYAGDIYSEKDPPHLVTGDRCVLCQQELDVFARSRMEKFDAYLDTRISQEAEEAKLIFTATAKSLLELELRGVSEVHANLAEFAELSPVRKQLSSKIMEFVNCAAERLNAVVIAIKSKEYQSLSALADLPDLSEEAIVLQISALESEALEFDRVSTDNADERRRLDYANLTDQRKLFSDIELIVDRRNKLFNLHCICECRKACSTLPVTKHISALRRNLLTPSLTQHFEDELVAFDLTYLPLKLNDRGELGDSRLQIALEATQRISKNSDILSEGEQRALALAGFLAELKELDGAHGIVIDDPVSSLDHSRMEAVAKRLVEEAKHRQVIIFTHSLFFHHAVTTEAMRQAVPTRVEWISKNKDGKFGIVDNNQKPWLLKNVKHRILSIEEELKSSKSGYDHNDENNRNKVRIFYTMMRETWERLIEEILFSDVISRFRPEIKTLQIRSASIDQEDRQKVYDGMKRCSQFSGHDQTAAGPPDLPTFESIMSDFETLRSYHNFCEGRKRSLDNQGKTREKEHPKPTVL